MGYLPTWQEATRAVRSDPNVWNFIHSIGKHGPKLPQQSKHYLLSKIPVIQ
jgi:hypothetical protein